MLPVTFDAEVNAATGQAAGSMTGAVKGDFVVAGHKAYLRVRGFVPAAPLGSFPRGWCVELPSHERGIAVPTFGVVAALRDAGKVLRRVGTERIRGVDTVHYQLVGVRPPLDVWVDDHDRLRRERLIHGVDHQTETIDLYDFGVSVSIAVPNHAPPCEPPLPKSTCTLGSSLKQRPICAKATTTGHP
jgi:hypothetical protein